MTELYCNRYPNVTVIKTTYFRTFDVTSVGFSSVCVCYENKTTYFRTFDVTSGGFSSVIVCYEIKTTYFRTFDVTVPGVKPAVPVFQEER